MRRFKQLSIIVLIIALSLITFAEHSLALNLLPWVRFAGGFQTTAGIGTGALTLNAFITEMDYANGDVWNANVAGVETIRGANVVLSGATRTGDYSFNGNPALPNDVILSIIGTDGYVYFSSILADGQFVQQPNSSFLWLNEGLNANDPDTLNLLNVSLRPNGDDGLHPSRYIDELAAYLGSSNVSGLKMQLMVPPVPGFNFTANSSGPITFGLIDGLQSLNAPPVADAGATTSNTTCIATSCDVTLNGSQSTDSDSTPGTNDDIISFEWFKNNVLIATGEVVAFSFPLGFHDVTLRVTDSAGAIDEVTITIVIDPAELSFIEIDKAHVKKDGKIKIYGKLALPAGVSHFNVNSIGTASIGLSDPLISAISESVDFIERANGNKWRYNSNTALGLNDFKIDWSGAKFSYQNGPLNIKTRHIGDEKTSLEITSCFPVTIDIAGTVVTIDENDRVTCPHAGVKVDGDDDGDSDSDDSDHGDTPDDDGDCTVRVKLPFALTADMIVNISGSVNDTVTVGDYLTAAVGKFIIAGRYNVSTIGFTSLVPNLELTVTLGNEGFSGTLVIDEATWIKIKPKEWKYKD